MQSETLVCFLYLFSSPGFVLFSHFSFVALAFATIMYINVCIWRFLCSKNNMKLITIGYTQFTTHFSLYVTLTIVLVFQSFSRRKLHH